MTSAHTGSLPRTVLVLLGAAAAVVVVAGMRSTAFILGPTILSLVLTITVHPLRVRLTRRLPGWAASTLCFTLLIVILVALAVSLVIAAARFADLASNYNGEFQKRVDDVMSGLQNAGVSESTTQTVGDGASLVNVSDLVTKALAEVGSLLTGAVLVVSLLLFNTFDSPAFARNAEELASRRPSLGAALTGLAFSTRRWLVVTTVFGLIVAVIDTIALQLMDIPAPLLWGLLAFLTNYIPNIGFFIGLAPPALLALLDGGFGKMIAVIAVYSVVNFIIQSVIQPKVVGQAVGFSSSITFLSMVLWSWALGPLGALLAVPISLMARAVIIDSDPATFWIRPLLGDRRPEAIGSPPAAAGAGDS
ncbi:MAG TPA: AI-2E family transporter [Nocardioides sp.]|nr:AI-2E family transporter [Nocardioides sp.]